MGQCHALACALALLVLPGAAQAAEDLVALPDDPPVELSGAHTYGEVYVDTELRLLGDTRIDASRIYIGPNAWIRTCMGPGDVADACTAGRSLTLNSTGSGITDIAGNALSTDASEVWLKEFIEVTADAHGPYAIDAGRELPLFGSISHTTDGQTFEWDFNNDGTADFVSETGTSVAMLEIPRLRNWCGTP